ncbi:arsenicals resistance [Basidiobolus ranarum]|uniref:Arsenicals resistance n=1 Tax=Basidiobolus ranarum TaxID=34480 RepID=A0ABR2WM39_9FUNG
MSDKYLKHHHGLGDVLVKSSQDETVYPASNTLNTQAAGEEKLASFTKDLGFLDTYLAIWIILAMIVGVLIGYFVPGVQEAFSTIQFDTVSVPIAIGLLVMMYPVLCKVQYEKMHKIFTQRQIWIQIVISMVLNWIVGPIVMTALAWATLPDLPGYRSGVIMVGLARCIAMVLIWNQLAGGDSDYCAILVAINSILQIALYSPYSILFINIIPTWFGVKVEEKVVLGMWPVAKSVLIYLGIPLVAGIITRSSLRSLKGDKWYDSTFMPRFSPIALIGLLYTIVIMFANQGHHIIANIGSVCRVAVPMLLYFILMFFITFLVMRACHFPYQLVVTQSFTAGSNNFELAIAVAVGVYGINSDQALAATIGPLIEVPVLLVLVYVALYLEKNILWRKPNHENAS